MVDVVSGSGLGLFGARSSNAGNAGVGRGGDRVYVNTTTGNLVIQSQDEMLGSVGLDLGLVRTYNSQGLLDDDNADNWRLGIHQRVSMSSGAVNAAGSIAAKLFGDGRVVSYAYDAGRALYVSTEGDGAHDTLSYDSSTGEWTWTEGSTRLAEKYDWTGGTGKLLSSRDADGNTLTYGYSGDKLTSVTDASGQVTTLTYVDGDLSQISVSSAGTTQVRTRYFYDGLHRLTQVVVDLDLVNTPDTTTLQDLDGNGAYDTINNVTYVTRYTYDGASRRVASITQGDGTVIGFTYELIDGQYRVTKYTEGGQGTIQLPRIVSAIVTQETVDTPTTRNIDASIAAPDFTQIGATQTLTSASEAMSDPLRVKYDAAGNGYAIWREGAFNNFQTQGASLYVKRFDAATGLWGPTSLLVSNSGAITIFDFAMDSEGNGVVAWTDNLTSGIKLRVVTAGSTTWGTAQTVPGSTVFNVAVRGNRAAVAWISNIDFNNQLCVARFDGTAWQATEVAAQSSAEMAKKPTVGIDANGNVMAAWQASVSGQGYGSDIVHGRRRDAATGQWGAIANVMTNVQPSDQSGGFEMQLDADPNGNFVLIEQRRAAIYDAAAGQWQAFINTGATGSGPGYQSFAMDAQGNGVLVYWGYPSLYPNNQDMWVRRYDPTTKSWGTPVQLTPPGRTGGGSVGSPAAFIRNGEAVVGWIMNESTHGAKSLYFARSVGSGWKTSYAPIKDATSQNFYQLMNAFGVDLQGNVSLTWWDSPTTIKAARYSSGYAYTIPTDATWESLAGTLYGDNSASAGTALQTAMSNQALTAGTALRNLPGTLSFTVSTTVPANPPYYRVPQGASWLTVTQAVYGTSDANAVAALRTALGDPALTENAHLLVPATLTFDTGGRATTITYTPGSGAPGQVTASASQTALTSTTLTSGSNYPLNTAATAQVPTGWSSVSTAAPFSWNLRVKSDSRGNAFAIWGRSGTSGYEYVVSRYDVVTGVWSTPLKVSSYVGTGLGQDALRGTSIGVDDQGNAVVSWIQRDSDAGIIYSVAAVTYDAATRTWSAPNLLERMEDNASLDGGDGALLSAAMNNGRAVVVWAAYSGVANVFAARFDGGRWSAAELIEDSPATSFWRVQASLADNGGIVVTMGGSTGTQYTRYDRTTESWSSVQSLLPAGSNHVFAADAHGNLTTVGYESLPTGVAYYARRFNGATGTWSTPTYLVAPGGSTSVYTNSIAADAAGNVVFAWLEYPGSSLPKPLRVMTYNSTSGTWSAPQTLESVPVGTALPSAPVYTAVNGSNAYVSWTDNSAGTNGWMLRSGTWTKLATTATFGVNAAIDTVGNLTAVYAASNTAVSSTTLTNQSVARYTVLAGDTWSSIANTLYGSTALADDLQRALGNPPLVTGGTLKNLPATLLDTTATPVTPYYTVRAGDTWASVALVVYGTDDVNAVAALRAALGNPPLSAGQQLNVPAALSYVPAPSLAIAIPERLATVETQNIPAYRNSGVLTTPPGSWGWTAPATYNYLGGNYPQTAFNANGDGIAVWAENSDIRMARFSQATGAWTMPVVVDSSNFFTATPMAAIDESGNAVITWFQYTGSAHALYAVRFDAATQTWGAVQTLVTFTTYAEAVPGMLSVAMKAGRIAVAYVQPSGSSRDIYVARFSGGSWATPQLIDNLANEAMKPIAAIDSDGNVSVVWTQYITSPYEQFHSRYSVSSGTWSTPAVIDTATSSAENAGIAFDGAGNAFAVWKESVDVKVRRYDKATNTWSTATTLDLNNASVEMPTLSVDAAGNAVVAWIQTAGATRYAYVIRYSAATQTWSGVYLLGQSSSYTPYTGASIVASSVNGRAAVAWLQSDGTRNDLYVSRFDGSQWLSGVVVESSTTNADQPALSLDSLGALTVFWKQGTAIYGSRYEYDNYPYYLVPSGATWRTVAAAVYGVNSDQAGWTLAAALGNPPLTAGMKLRGLPPSIGIPTQVTVPHYYTVVAGDTWLTIVQKVYGSRDPAAAAALQAKAGDPALTAGLHVTIPLKLNYGVQPTTNGLQATVTNALGQATIYKHDAAGRLAAVISAIGIETDYLYDSEGNVSAIVEDATGAARVSTFDYANGNLIVSRDAGGNTVKRIFNARNQLVAEIAYLGADTDGAGNTDQADAPVTTRYVYDNDDTASSEDHLRFTISADGRVTEHRYDAAGQRIATLVYAGAIYNVAGLAANATLTEAQLVSWSSTQDKTKLLRTDYDYDFRGLLRSATTFEATDAAGNGVPTNAAKTQYVYDQRGQLLQTLDARGGAVTPAASNANTAYATTLTYDGLGRVLTSTQWLASGQTRTTATQYDDVGNRTLTTLANGLVTTSVYDRVGQLLNVTASGAGVPADSVTSYGYDSVGRLRAITDATGISQQFLYDAAGRKVAEIDGNGTLTEYVYDRYGRIVKSIRYADALTSATRGTLVDANGNFVNVDIATLRDALPTTVGRASDQISRNVYDGAGRLVYTVDPTGAVMRQVFDGANRVTDVYRFATTVTIGAGVGEVLESTIAALVNLNDAGNRRTRNFYDGAGNLIATLDGEGYLIEYLRNSAGQLWKQIEYANQTIGVYQPGQVLDSLRPATDNETSIDPEQDIVTYFFYDGHGRKVGVLDGEGYLTETVYTASGQVDRTIRYGRHNGAGTDLGALAYQANDTLATLKSRVPAAALRHTTQYTYDGAGQLLTTTTFEGVVTGRTYDSIGALIATTAAQGLAEARTQQVRYDLLGRVIRELSGEGSAALAALGAGATQAQIDQVWDRYGVLYAYDRAGRRISATTRPYDVTTGEQTLTTFFFYDEDSNLRFTVNARGERTERRYNALGQVTDEITYNNRVSTAGLQGGLLTGTTLALLSGDVDAQRDVKTSFTYTLRGELKTSVTALGGSVTNAYNAFGELYTRTSVDVTQSALHRFTYDRRGLLKVTNRDPNGIAAQETRSYDAFGRLTSIQDARSGIWRTEYDRLDRETATVDALFNRRTKTYDAFSRVLTSRDALNNVTRFAYEVLDEQGNAKSIVVTTPENVSFTTYRNAHGEAALVKDARGVLTATQYDRNGAVVRITRNGVEQTFNTFDTEGRLLTTRDANGNTVTFAYDAANRVFTRTLRGSAVDANLQLTTTYTYDGQGRVTDVADPSGSATHTEYDRDGRVVDVYEDYGTGRLNLRTHYDYDIANRTVTTTEGYGATGPAFIPRVTRDTYDVLGRRISQIVDPGSGTNPSTGKAYLNLTTLFDYDRAGNLIRKRDANGRYTWYVYDAGNRLTFVVDPPNDTVGAALYGRSSVTRKIYDAENRVISERRFATTIASPGTTVELLTSTILGQLGAGTAQDQIEMYVYDRDGRQTYSIDAGGVVTFFEYDGNGNVTRRTQYADRTTTSSLYTSASYNASTGVHTLYTSSGTQDTISPTAGQDRVSISVYDNFDRAIYEIDALGDVTALTYDAAGNIIASTQYATQDATVTAATVAGWVGTHTSANDRTTRYWYDGAGRVRFTLDAEGWLVERRYDDLTRQDTELVYANKPTVPPGTTLTQLVAITNVIDGDPRDQITVSQRDAGGRVVRVDDALGHSEYYGYDALGNRIWFTNAKGTGAQDVQYTWRFEYDANSRLVKEITPSVSVTSITTDGSGLHSTVASVALETVMTYDALGNLLTRTEAANTSQARTTTYEYDSMGRQIVTRYPAAEVYDYNSNAVVLDSTLYSATVYDALGNAIAGRDVAGNWSHKGYDTLGRIVWEVDAQRYLTFHIRDAFGNVTETRRFAAARDSNVGSATAPSITYPTNPAVGANDRVLTREYDKLNRVTRVIEPAAYVFDSNRSAGAQEGQATPQTVFLYDAFGNVVRESRLIHGVNAGSNPAGPDSDPAAWASTYRYYDHRDQLVAEVDPERYLTKFQYDETGDLSDKTEYAARVASVSLSTIPANPPTTATSGLNRHTTYIHDQLNRLTSELFTDVEYFNFDDPFAQSPKYSGTRITSFGYDAIGNQTSVSVNNATTYSYYDVLGRVIAVAEPRRTIGHSQPVGPQPPTSLTPYTEMYRDAHGNIVRQVQYAGDIGFVSGSAKPTVSATLVNDARNRVTLTRYDLHGHIVETATSASVNGQAVDSNNAGFAIQHAAYTKRGEIAKQWQTITTVNPDTTPGAPATINETLSTTFHYDALGRQVRLVEPQTATRSRIVESDYNAFGEITERRTLNPNGVGVFGKATYEYDNSGRLWRTNSDSGVYRVYLYDLEGRATAEIKSQTQDLYGTSGSLTLANVLAVSASSLMRSETVYDLLGRAVQQRGPSFELVNSAWAVSGSAQTHTYNTVDRWGNVTKVTDELGRSTDYFYNQMDQVIRVVQPLVDVVETRGGIIRDNPDAAAPRLRPVTFNFYDLYGNLIGKTDAIDAPDSTAATFVPGSATYRIRYNEVGQVIQETADLGTKKYTLDRFGQRIQAVDEMGFKTRYQYDQAGNLVGLARERGALSFDADGLIAPTDFPNVVRPSTYTQATGYEVLRYSYDEAGRRIAETTGEFTGTSGNAQETIRYWYDLLGNLTRKREPIGQVTMIASDSSSVVVRYETTYEFDVNGNKIKETDGNGSWMTWDYDQFNRLRGHQQLTNANAWMGASLYGSAGDVITYNYDFAGMLDSQTSTFGQNIDYQYDAAGHLRRIVENSTARMAGSNTVMYGVDRDTDYRYDALGLRVGERTVIDNLTHQNAVITYDELDRLKSVVDLRSSVTYFYDARGNRTRVQETYLDQNSVSRSHEDWYVYDALNRVTTSGGADSHSTIREVVINSTQGTEITYDLRGNRKTSRTFGERLTQHNDVDENGVVSTWYSESAGYDEHLYFYDGESRVITDFRYMDKWVDGVLQVSGINGPYGHGIVADERYYDHASRQIYQTTRSLADNALGFDVRLTATTYDDNGRVSQQTTGLNGLMESDVLYGTAYYDPGYYWPSDDGSGQGSYSPAGWRPGYDAAGVLRGYRLHAYPAGRSTYFTNHSFAYALADGYLEVAHSAQSTSTNGSPPPQPGSNRRIYNVNGEMVSYFDPADTSGANNRIFATNASGQVLTAVSGSAQYTANNAAVFVPVLSHYQGAGWSTGNAQLYRFANGQYIGTFGTLQTGTFEADFDTNFAPISANYPTAVPSQITIQSGDTLRSIAQRVFGDGNLWYVLADANGLTVSPDQSLDEQVGWSLRVPNEVISLSNNATSFRPFNVNDALGDTSPIQPAPPPPKAGGGGCGIIGQIIVIIVAIVVAYFTAGAALSAMGPLLSAAFGAAVGSVASQLVGIALGVQEKFSWKAVAVAAVTAGLTKGIGVDKLSVVGSSADSVVNQAINGAISNAIGQGVNIAVGLQDKFSWRDLAVSAVSAPIASRVGKAVGTRMDPKFGSEDYTSTFKANFVSGLASGASTVAVRAAIGGKVEIKSALADVFGNALGNSLVEAIKFHGQVTDVASELAGRIGVDPKDPRAKAVLRRAAEIQLGRNASTNELRSLSRSYLELAGASQADIDATMALYEEHLFKRDSINTGTYTLPVPNPADDVPADERPPLQLTITDGIDSTAYGSARVDDLMIGAGEIGQKVGQYIESKPALKWGLVAIDVAAGPAAYVVRNAVLKTPIGDALESASAWALDKLSDPFEDAGYDEVQAGHGGGGALTLGSVIGLGASVGLKVILRSGLAKRLMYVGRTPGKSSTVGLKVQAQMRADGKLIDGPNGPEFYSVKNQKWYPLKEADMSHKKAAVEYWNEEGRYHGARSPEVKKFMNDDTNYTLEHYSVNRSEGARMRVEYAPPATSEEIAEWLKRPR